MKARATDSERAAASIKARVADGYRRLSPLLINPQAARALDRLTRDGSTMTAAIEQALIEAAARR